MAPQPDPARADVATSAVGPPSARPQPGSIRTRLLALSLLPLLGVLPLLGLILLLWGDNAIDRLLIGKVRSDLAVAQGYFERVTAEVGSGTQAVAGSQRLHQALQHPASLDSLLGQARQQHHLDFLNLLTPDLHLRASEHGQQASGPLLPNLAADPSGALASVARVSAEQLEQIAPGLAGRARIALVPTEGAAPTDRQTEDRALLLIAQARITAENGDTLGWLQGGVLLNRNLDFIDHINEIVYPAGSLPFGSQGTATLFLDDVRISTNVRLFDDAAEIDPLSGEARPSDPARLERADRAIGTRVSSVVRNAVLGRGETWLDRAFVVKDWYVSGYLPLADATGQRVGMLYVGYLERPFVAVKHAVLVSIGVAFFAVMCLAAWWSLHAAGSIFRPLERMAGTMRQVESGDLTARVGAMPQGDEIGRLAGTLDHLLDVIDDKTRALQRWGAELDHKVAERTAELAERTRDLETSHASLQAAQQQLVRSEKLAAIGQLTASIAHEVNNPIAVIQGNLDLMRELLGPAAAPVQDELKLIDAQVERMRLIVTQLLQFARPNDYAGYVEQLQVREVVEASLVLVRHLLERSRITLDWHCGATRPVAINRQELQQVLINLLVNAIQAMQSGPAPADDRPSSLLLRSRDGASADGRPVVCIDVIDQGPGLSEAALTRLFQPFFTTRRDGNGLGLWISRSLLERYGAELHAANRPPDEGPGAVFTIELLAAAEAANRSA